MPTCLADTAHAGRCCCNCGQQVYFEADRERHQIEIIPEVVLSTFLTGTGLIIPAVVMGLIFLMLFGIRAFGQKSPALGEAETIEVAVISATT